MPRSNQPIVRFAHLSWPDCIILNVVNTVSKRTTTRATALFPFNSSTPPPWVEEVSLVGDEPKAIGWERMTKRPEAEMDEPGNEEVVPSCSGDGLVFIHMKVSYVKGISNLL